MTLTCMHRPPSFSCSIIDKLLLYYIHPLLHNVIVLIVQFLYTYHDIHHVKPTYYKCASLTRISVAYVLD